MIMDKYIIKKVSSRKEFESLKLEELSVNTTPWGGYAPKTYGVLAHDDEKIYVHMRSDESPIRAEVSAHDGPVHTDSCMEFFFSPDPEKHDYFNMEINPKGMLKLHYGPGRHGRVNAVENPKDYAVVPQVCEDGWALTYEIPYSVIRRFSPSFEGTSGSVIKANLYKCGEMTEKPHLATCYMIDIVAYPKPDFHRPEYFREMIFE